MKRYYGAAIYQAPDAMGILAWRHHLQVAYPGVDYVGGQIKVDPATGQPTEKALLVLVGSIDHKKFQADPKLVPFPAVALDMKVSAMHTKTKLDCKAGLVGLGFTEAEVDAVFNGADGMRDVLEYFGKKNNPDFSADVFDLDEGG